MFPDVGIRIVDKRTGFDIAICIDVQIIAATSNTTADIFAVMLEINGEHRLGISVSTDSVVHNLTLFGSGKEFRNCIVSIPPRRY